MSDAQPTLDGFIDDAPAVPPAVILDRSSAERTANCPHQAWFIDRRMVTNSSEISDVGVEVHRIIGESVHERATNGITPHDMREKMLSDATASRPDIQPRVVAALRKAAWPLTGLICYLSGEGGNERNPDDLLRYDGGEGVRSGQLAWDIFPATAERGPVRITGELDLLTSTPSAEELEITDYKSGWRWFTATQIQQSFQFGFYAALVFLNYQQVQRVRVKVFMTAYGESAAAVEFTRGRDLWPILERIKSAAHLYLKHYRAENAEDVPAWPTPDKCVLCDAARYCHLAHKPAKSVAVDPEAAVRQLVVFDAAAAALRKDLTNVRRARGVDLDFGDVCYGTDKPKATRAPACDVYEIDGRRSDFGKAPEPAAV